MRLAVGRKATTRLASRNRVPSFAMDRPALHVFVRELAGSEQLRTFVDAFPAPARVSEAALPLLLPPPAARPAAIELEIGDETGLEALREELALAGYEASDRVEQRGQFAVRGGIVDVFPSTGREPLRIEFFGDEIEAIRAFSPFTQR